MTSLEHDHDLPFGWGWRGMDLGPARYCQYTYALYPYESLPPIRELHGTLDWLGSVEVPDDRAPVSPRDTAARAELARLEHEAAPLGLTLPPAYVRLMSSSELLDRIPEYAGSWFQHAEHIVPCVVSTRGHLLRFLSDQQMVVVWFLYLTPQGHELVLGSHNGLIDASWWEEMNDGVGPDEEELAEVIANARICAPSFEAFIYRFWLETTLYYKVYGVDNTPLTDEERRYLAHYGAGMDGATT